MRRRSYLAAAGTALSALAAGCTASGVGTGSPTTAKPTTDATTRTTESSAVTVDDVTLQPAAVQLQTDYLTVDGAGQYLFVDASVEAESVDRSEFAVRLAGERYRPLSGSDARRLWRLYGDDGWNPGSGGLLAFGLPESTESPDAEAVLELPGGERELDAGLRERLAVSPSFSWEFSVPATVQRGHPVPLEVRVVNDSDAMARFVAGLNRSGPQVASTPVESLASPVAPGGSEVFAMSAPVTGRVASDDVGDGERDVRFALHTADGSTSRDVRVVESE